MDRKKTLILSFIILIFALIILKTCISSGNENSDISDTQPDNTVSTRFKLPEYYKVLIEQTGEVIELTPRDYIAGCLFAAIPASYEMEMLKAQAIVANTYGLLLYENKGEMTTGDLKGADFSDNSKLFQGYFTPQTAKEMYGSDYDFIANRIYEAVDYGINYVLVYERQLIFPAFHSISTGKTESAQAVFNVDYPYLVVADSKNDVLSPDYYGSRKMLVRDVGVALMNASDELSLDDDYKNWFSEPKYSESGILQSIKCKNITLSGIQLQNALNLRSPAIQIEFSDEMFVFKTKGFGHNVGLSLFGGNQMAYYGSTCGEILHHYYKGVEALVLK